MEAHRCYYYLDTSEQFLKYETDNNLGGVLLAEGKYEESRIYLESALKIMSSGIGMHTLAYFQTSANLVVNRSRFGDLSSAKSLVAELEAEMSGGSLVGFEVAPILGAVAEYFVESRDYEEAEHALRHAIAILTAGKDKGETIVLLARTALKLSELELDRNRVDLAEQELAAESEVINQGILPDTRASAQHDRIIGRIALSRGAVDEAVVHLERSIGTLKKRLSNEHPIFVWSFIPLARAHLAKKDINGAKVDLQSARLIANQWLHPNSRAFKELQAIELSIDQLASTE